MPRKPILKQTPEPYHITARCINREWFALPLETTWSIMEDYLYLVSHLYGLRIHSFVLMPNHFHLLASAPNLNLSASLNYFMRETSREITRLSGRINQTYGGRHHKTRVLGLDHFMTVYKYIYQNPLRAGLCHFVEEYPYSTLAGRLGLRKLIIPLVEDSILFTPELDESTLQWLNRPPHDGHVEEVRKALKRSEFQLKPSRPTGRISALNAMAF